MPGATLAVIGQEDRLEQIDLAARPDTVATYRIYVRASQESAAGYLDAGNLHADRQNDSRQSAISLGIHRAGQVIRDKHLTWFKCRNSNGKHRCPLKICMVSPPEH